MAISRMSGFWFESVGYLIRVVGTVLVVSSLAFMNFYNSLHTALSTLLFHVWCLAFKSTTIIKFLAMLRREFSSSIWWGVSGLLNTAINLISSSLVFICMAMLVIKFVGILTWRCINLWLTSIAVSPASGEPLTKGTHRGGGRRT